MAHWKCELEKMMFVEMLVVAGSFTEAGKFIVDLEVAEGTNEFNQLRKVRTVGAIKTQINRVKLRLNGVRHQWSDKVARNFDRELKLWFPNNLIPDEVEFIETGITRTHRYTHHDHETVEQVMVGKTVLNNLSGHRTLMQRFIDWIIAKVW